MDVGNIDHRKADQNQNGWEDQTLIIDFSLQPISIEGDRHWADPQYKGANGWRRIPSSQHDKRVVTDRGDQGKVEPLNPNGFGMNTLSV